MATASFYSVDKIFSDVEKLHRGGDTCQCPQVARMSGRDIDKVRSDYELNFLRLYILGGHAYSS